MAVVDEVAFCYLDFMAQPVKLSDGLVVDARQVGEVAERSIAAQSMGRGRSAVFRHGSTDASWMHQLVQLCAPAFMHSVLVAQETEPVRRLVPGIVTIQESPDRAVRNRADAWWAR